QFSAAFRESPLTIRDKVLAFSPLLEPYRGAFVAPWGLPWVAPAGLRTTLQSLSRLRQSLLAVRALATWAFVLLFVVGPLLTHVAGPSAAIVYTAIGVYWTALLAVVAVWWQPGAFGVTSAPAAWLSLDLLVCPAFLPNLVRKITVMRTIEVDGPQVLFATAASATKEQFVTQLEGRTEDLLDGAVADDPEVDELRSYVETVRAAR